MRAVTAVLPAILLASLPAGATAAEPVEVDRAITYGSGRVGAPQAGSARLLLDLYHPARRSRARRPVVVVVHGGGFRGGSRRDPGIVRISRALAARGIVAASIDYRLLGREPVPSRRVAPLVRALPGVPLLRAVTAAVDDTLTAVAYLRRNARRLGIDVRRLGLVGSSAGAITAIHVAYVLDDHGIDGPRVRFAGSLWGGLIVPPPGRDGRAPATQLDRGEPPLFAVHGDADTTVGVRQSDELVARARARGVRSEYHRIAGGRHGYEPSRFFTARVTGGQTPFARLLRFARSALR